MASSLLSMSPSHCCKRRYLEDRFQPNATRDLGEISSLSKNHVTESSSVTLSVIATTVSPTRL